MSYDNWRDIKAFPLIDGQVVVSVQMRHANGAISSFTSVVTVDEGEPLGADGDAYIHAADITHWQKLLLPNPVLPVDCN